MLDKTLLAPHKYGLISSTPDIVLEINPFFLQIILCYP